MALHSHLEKPFVRVVSLSLLLVLNAGFFVQAEAVPVSELLPALLDKNSSAFQKDLEQIYQQREYDPIWVTSQQLNDPGQTIFQLLNNAAKHGLNADDYDSSELHWLQRSLELLAKNRKNFRANLLARFEMVLSENLMKFLDHASAGRLTPEMVNGKWYLRDRRRPLIKIFQEVLNEGLPVTLETLTTGHEGLAPLLAKLDQYRAIEAVGGWPIIPDGPLLAQGHTHDRVPTLRLRLAASGDLLNLDTHKHFDHEVAEGVRRFQQRHGLSVDGMVGPETLSTLNVSIETRIKQILLNLERRRWLPEKLGNVYVAVNIPAFELTGYRDGQKELTMPVIVGKPMNQTPIFSDNIEYIVFNPYWNVPRSIVEEEILPKIEKDQEYLEKKNYEIVDAEDALVAIDQLTIENIQNYTVRIRQRPGPTNALGLVKFMFPNDHAIYLHDTPADHLFDATQRDFSHGCIRVKRPSDLANFLLKGTLSREEIVYRIESAARQEEKLPKPIPVYILYKTAWVADDGTLQFRNDIYGHDENLWAALRPILSDNVDTVSQARPVPRTQGQPEL